MSYLIKCIPPEFRENRKQCHSMLLLLRVNICIFSIALMMLIGCVSIGYSYGILTTGIAIIFATVFPFVLRYSHSLFVAGNYFTGCSIIIFTMLCLGTGNINSPFVFWFMTIPAIVLFYAQRKYTTFWIGVTATCVLTLSIFSLNGISYFEFPNTTHLTVINILSLCLITGLFCVTVNSFRTSYRYVNKKLSKTVNALEKSNEELQNYAYIASHDLQSPLKSINSTIKALKLHKKDILDPVESQCLSFIEDSTDRLSKLIEEILNYSRAGQHEEVLAEVNLNEIINVISKQIQTAAQYPNHLIKFAALPTIVTDRVMIFQLLQNIIENGLKYNRSEYPSVIIEVEKQEKFYALTLTDNGIGIEEKNFDKVFGMFNRLKTDSDFLGTGIGLAICKKIIGQNGGKIWITSTVGEGTTFHINLPIKKTSKPVQQAVLELA